MNYVDGFNCINVYSKGRTYLGRMLSNFAHTPFDCEDGHFESVEGYWYWLSTKDNHLRTLHGYQAKKYGRQVRGVDWPKSDEFKEKIRKAIRKKIIQNQLFNPLADSSLPFVHFYVTEFGIEMIDDGSGWMMTFLEECRRKLQEGGYPK